MSDAGELLRDSRERIGRHLDASLPATSEPPALLHEAMRYAVLSGGKRLRAALCFAAAQACGRAADVVLPVAAAVELVHAYSLVHDDLPAMDDDEQRRGQPTVHVKYGEALAILVGDALLAAAFAELARAAVPAVVIARLASAAGSRELVGGQVDDLMPGPEPVSLVSIRAIHRRKTAALFRFAVWGAARCCDATAADLERFDRFAEHFGLAFQALDDLEDGERGGGSILHALSAEEARSDIASSLAAAEEALTPLGGRAKSLGGLARDLARRLS